MGENDQIKIELDRAKEDLGELETYIKEFSAFLPLAVCTVNPAKVIIDINQAFVSLTGYSFSDIVGEPLEKIFLEKKELDDLLKFTEKGNLIKTDELTVLSKSGKEIFVGISASARQDLEGNFIGSFLALVNNTEIKKFREDLEKKVKERTKELNNSKAALMNILEEVEVARHRAEEEKNKTLAIITDFSDGLLVFDKEDRLSLMNYQAEKIFDIKSEEIIGRHFLELSQTPYLFALINSLGREIQEVSRQELVLKEGLIVEISAAEIKKGEEKIGFFVIAHDITREKEIEKMKSEFVSISAHQLRTPLSAIKWTLRAILDGDVGQLNPGQVDLLQKTYTSNERMITLVNDLLDVTRIEEGRHLFKPSLSDVEPVIEFVMNSFKGESERKQIQLEFKKPFTKAPKIMLDVEKIKLAIQNLIGNAIRYTPQGGMVTISLKHDKKEVEMLVKDTGIGIPQDQQQKIFTKFFRSQNAVRMETEGSGLGLFITKNIVEAHGGRIWFESEEGKGTTFHMAVPIKEEFEEFLKEF
jgi:PAS domain S-box-containing protein